MIHDFNEPDVSGVAFIWNWLRKIVFSFGNGELCCRSVYIFLCSRRKDFNPHPCQYRRYTGIIRECRSCYSEEASGASFAFAWCACGLCRTFILERCNGFLYIPGDRNSLGVDRTHGHPGHFLYTRRNTCIRFQHGFFKFLRF